MGYPQGHKEQTRERIILAARKLWKSKGFSAASVDKVMEEAGLTRGGFYAHFKSKEELLLEVIEENLAREKLEQWHREGITDIAELHSRVFDFYLSQAHRDHPDQGCPLTALSQEVTHLGKKPREKMGQMIRRFADWLSGEDQNRSKGLAKVSLMVGAVSLSRVVGDEELSDEILTSAREALRREGS